MTRREASRADRGRDLDLVLGAMFRSLSNRPLPDSLRAVIDQLQEEAGAPLRSPMRRRR